MIPSGALAVSDPVEIDLRGKGKDVLTVSIYLEKGQNGLSITSHPGSRTTSWFAPGNKVKEANITGAGTLSAAHWYVDVVFSPRLCG